MNKLVKLKQYARNETTNIGRSRTKNSTDKSAVLNIY